MDPENLKFSSNWNNKLDCEKAFSTIRLRQSKFYIGAEFNYFLVEKGHVTKQGFCKITYVHHFKIDKLTEAMARLDTGLSCEDCIKMVKTMYKNIVKDWEKQELTFMILVKIPLND